MSDIGQEDFRVELDDGKYTAIRLVGGGTRWLRHGEPWQAAEDSWCHAHAINSLIDKLHDTEALLGQANKRLQGDAAAVGARAAHYGDGVQPWDHIVASGWGPAFAAGNALKYVRRHAAKNGEDDLKKGRWYYHELIGMAASEHEADVPVGQGVASGALARLELLLVQDERALLRKKD